MPEDQMPEDQMPEEEDEMPQHVNKDSEDSESEIFSDVSDSLLIRSYDNSTITNTAPEYDMIANEQEVIPSPNPTQEGENTVMVPEFPTSLAGGRNLAKCSKSTIDKIAKSFISEEASEASSEEGTVTDKLSFLSIDR